MFQNRDGLRIHSLPEERCLVSDQGILEDNSNSTQPNTTLLQSLRVDSREGVHRSVVLVIAVDLYKVRMNAVLWTRFLHLSLDDESKAFSFVGMLEMSVFFFGCFVAMF